MPDQRRREGRPQVDECRAGGKDCADQQPDRDRDLEAGPVLAEEDVRRAQGVEAEETPGRHEGEGEQEHSSVPAPIGGVPRRITEDEREHAREPEHEEVEPVVLEVRVEPGPEEQRGQADERQRRDHGSREHRRPRAPPAGARRVLSDVRRVHRPVPWRIVRVPTRGMAASRLEGHYAAARASDSSEAVVHGARPGSGYTASSGRGSSAGRAHG